MENKRIIHVNKNLINNIISLSGIQLLTMLMPVITFPYLVKTLGGELFGLLAFTTSVVIFLQIFVDFGFGLFAPREIARLKENNDSFKDFVQLVFTAKFILLVISSLILFVLLIFVDKFSTDKLLLLLTFGTVVGQCFIPDWFFQGVEENKTFLYIVSICKIIGACATIFIVNEPKDYLFVPIINSLTIIVIAFLSLLVLSFKYKISLPLKFDFLNALSLLKKTMDLFKMKAFIECYRSSNPILLGFIGNNSIVGYYVIAEKVISIIQSLQFPLGRALLPYTVRRIELFGKRHHKKLIVKLIPFLFLGYSIVSVGVFFSSEIIINMISKQANENTILNLQILSLVIIFGGINYFLSIVYMIPLGYEKITSKFLMIVGGSNLLISFILISNFLNVGASISLIISEAFLLLLLLSFIIRKRKANYEY